MLIPCVSLLVELENDLIHSIIFVLKFNFSFIPEFPGLAIAFIDKNISESESNSNSQGTMFAPKSFLFKV